MRSQFYRALKGNLKKSSTKDLLGIDIEICRLWIDFQMTPEVNWNNIDIDHVKPVVSFGISKDEELREAFSWKNTQPILKKTIFKKLVHLIG